MRALLSLAALLIVLAVVWRLAGTQLSSLSTSRAPEAGAAGAASLPAGIAPMQVPQEVAQQVQRGLAAGAAARASEPTP